MHIYLDNTGLHAVYRCLEGRANDEVDVAGLLQFATQVVFCDRLTVGAYEVSEVRNRTCSLLVELQSLGIEGQIVQQCVCSPEEWVVGCMRAGQAFAEDIEQLVPDEPFALAGTEPDFPLGTVSRDVELDSLLSKDHTEVELADRASAALERKAAGMVEYTFAACAPLWSAARTTYRHRGGWSKQTSDYLAVLLRLYRNRLFARDMGAEYSPAVPRARLLRQEDELLYGRLLRVLTDAAAKLRSGELPVPAVSSVLIAKAKGDPRALLREARHLRDRMGAIRQILGEFHDSATLDEVDRKLHVTRRLREVSRCIEAELGLADAPALHGALRITFVLGLPAIGLDVVRLAEWFRHRWMRRQTAVLTELSANAAFGAKQTLHYKRLVAHSMSRLGSKL